jgi:hypothetical protein
MSSNIAASHVELTGFKLVRDVLRTTGLQGSASDATSDMKRDASTFLSSEFWGGVGPKSALLNSLANRKRATQGARFNRLPKDSAVDRWQDEGGR